LKSHKIALTGTQSGSGTPSPDNVRPISGFSELGINATGKNLLRLNRGSETYNGVTFTVNEDFSITTSGEYQGQNSIYIASYLVTLRAGTYILTGCPSGGSYSDYVLRIENSQAQRIALDTGNGETFTLTEDTPVFCRIYIYSQNGVGKTFYPMLRMINTNSDYEPFGIYTTITIGSTVYIGEYDARTGVLTVTHLIKTINDLTGFDSMSSPSNHVFRAKANDLVGLEYVSGNVPTNAICSHFDAKAWGPISAMDNGKFAIAPLDDGKIVFIAHDYSTVSDFLTDLGTAQIAYPLATPTTIQLPPCPIDTLQGINNIWADTGETTASYIKIQP
jgi:hypothetical protein